MRLVIRQACNGVGGVTWNPGDVVDAPDLLAREIIAHGWAAPADGEVPAAPPLTTGQILDRDAVVTVRDPAPKRGRR